MERRLLRLPGGAGTPEWNKALVTRAFQPVLAQAQACGYILIVRIC